MKIVPVALSILLSTAITAVAGTPGQHDCVAYEPTEASGVFNSDWEAPNERDDWDFTVPTDPGGGYVTVTLTANNPVVVPGMDVAVFPPGAAVIMNGGAADSGQQLSWVFEAAAGIRYNLKVYPSINAPLNEHPVDYSLDWVFTSRVDCYEPNDAAQLDWPDPVAAAKAIPVDLAIEATDIVGYDENFISAPRRFDWYKFTLDEPLSVQIGTLRVANDVLVGLRLFNEAGGFVLSAPIPPQVGDTTRAARTTLPAGTYYLEYFPAVSGNRNARLEGGEEIPNHFVTSYQLGISHRISLECLGGIHCDGFESLDIP